MSISPTASGMTGSIAPDFPPWQRHQSPFDASTVVEWVDPQTGSHYVAKRFGDESLMAGRTTRASHPRCSSGPTR
jgi:hypothetical protein